MTQLALDLRPRTVDLTLHPCACCGGVGCFDGSVLIGVPCFDCGAPGCGKTMLGKAAATAIAGLHTATTGNKGVTEAGARAAGGGFYYVKGPELLNMYVGNTEASIRKVFDGARRHKKRISPTILHGAHAIVPVSA